MAIPLRVAASAVLCALGLVLLSTCSAGQDGRASDSAGRDPLNFLSQPFNEQQALAFIGGSFPAGATETHAMGETALDTMVIARFVASRQDVADWLTGLGITAPLETGYSPFLSADPPYSAAADWWAPPVAVSTTNDFSGLQQRVGSNYFNIVIEEIGDGNVTVHLQVFNT